jgi:hypothetical protein
MVGLVGVRVAAITCKDGGEECGAGGGRLTVFGVGGCNTVDGWPD